MLTVLVWPPLATEATFLYTNIYIYNSENECATATHQWERAMEFMCDCSAEDAMQQFQELNYKLGFVMLAKFRIQDVH